MKRVNYLENELEIEEWQRLEKTKCNNKQISLRLGVGLPQEKITKRY